jgi:hypothetical protein
MYPIPTEKTMDQQNNNQMPTPEEQPQKPTKNIGGIITAIIVISLIIIGSIYVWRTWAPKVPSAAVNETANQNVNTNQSGKSADENNEKICKDLCGDGICQEIVCLASGCPCAETPESCPKDCE